MEGMILLASVRIVRANDGREMVIHVSSQGMSGNGFISLPAHLAPGLEDIKDDPAA